jgi:hypothetical protein
MAVSEYFRALREVLQDEASKLAREGLELLVKEEHEKAREKLDEASNLTANIGLLDKSSQAAIEIFQQAGKREPPQRFAGKTKKKLRSSPPRKPSVRRTAGDKESTPLPQKRKPILSERQIAYGTLAFCLIEPLPASYEEAVDFAFADLIKNEGMTRRYVSRSLSTSIQGVSGNIEKVLGTLLPAGEKPIQLPLTESQIEWIEENLSPETAQFYRQLGEKKELQGMTPAELSQLAIKRKTKSVIEETFYQRPNQFTRKEIFFLAHVLRKAPPELLDKIGIEIHEADKEELNQILAKQKPEEAVDYTRAQLISQGLITKLSECVGDWTEALAGQEENDAKRLLIHLSPIQDKEGISELLDSWSSIPPSPLNRST